MAIEPFLGEIRMFAGTFQPRGYALCNGQILPISQNTALFSLLGTNFGGNGQTTFGLPDLRGRVPIGQGQALGGSFYSMGDLGGVENVTLVASNMPPHTHAAKASTLLGNQPAANGDSVAKLPSNQFQFAPANSSPGAYGTGSTGTVGSNQPHNNMQPYLTVTFIIATQGIFPSRN